MHLGDASFQSIGEQWAHTCMLALLRPHAGINHPAARESHHQLDEGISLDSIAVVALNPTPVSNAFQMNAWTGRRRPLSKVWRCSCMGLWCIFHLHATGWGALLVHMYEQMLRSAAGIPRYYCFRNITISGPAGGIFPS